MNTLRRARNAVVAVTIAAWLWLCWAFWHQLIREAANSPEIYTREPRFQLINFVVQYLWLFALLLAACILIEWSVFWLIGRVVVRSGRPAA